MVPFICLGIYDNYSIKYLMVILIFRCFGCIRSYILHNIRYINRFLLHLRSWKIWYLFGVTLILKLPETAYSVSFPILKNTSPEKLFILNAKRDGFWKTSQLLVDIRQILVIDYWFFSIRQGTIVRQNKEYFIISFLYFYFKDLPCVQS